MLLISLLMGMHSLHVNSLETFQIGALKVRTNWTAVEIYDVVRGASSQIMMVTQRLDQHTGTLLRIAKGLI